MTTKLQKFLKGLTASERQVVDETVKMIVKGRLEGLQVAKLVGSANIYRVRKGRLRIIFRKTPTKEPEIIQVSKRDDKTYKDF